MGVAMANMGVKAIEELKKFKETISIMLVSGVFIILTANIDPQILFSIDWRGGLFIALLLFVIRPATLLASSIGSKMSWQEVFLTGWVAPRGIVCAAVAGVLGPYLVGIGYADVGEVQAICCILVEISRCIKTYQKWAQKPKNERYQKWSGEGRDKSAKPRCTPYEASRTISGDL